jgi:hypothetical protein
MVGSISEDVARSAAFCILCIADLASSMLWKGLVMKQSTFGSGTSCSQIEMGVESRFRGLEFVIELAC